MLSIGNTIQILERIGCKAELRGNMVCYLLAVDPQASILHVRSSSNQRLFPMLEAVVNFSVLTPNEM